MDQPLAVYLPRDRYEALATGTPLREHAQGAVLFADISGFTPLTEALTRELGARRGVEELSRQLNLVYDMLIQEVDRYRGNVIDFAGDAITCWFDEDAGMRATACGLAMQEAMRAFATVQLPSGGSTSLAMKVAVASGAVRRFLVGDPQVQLIDTLAGAPLARMAAAERMAERGEVVLDEDTAHSLENRLTIRTWRTDERGGRFAVVAGLHTTVAPQPWPSLSSDTLRLDDLRSWLLPVIYERLRGGQGEFLTELRPAVALFLRFSGIDYDADPEAGQKLDAYIRWVQEVVARYEGTLLSLTIGDKGSYLYLAFGVPIAHEDDSRRAALAALALQTPPEELSFLHQIQIGLSRGTMRTGTYGGRTRRTYGSLGDEVNLAARLMQHAEQGQIIASGRVQAATESLFHWEPLPEIYVKGKRDPIPVFALLGPTSTIHMTEPTYMLPIIGRQAELALIQDKMALVRQGRGQLLGITAEAGMGKSRLVAEAIRLSQAQGLTGYAGECQSYGTNTPYLVWQPIWRAFFGLDASASHEAQAAQLAHAISELDPMLLPRLPLLAPVLGLPLADNELTRTFSPDLRKSSREALLVDLLRARARRLGEQQGALLLVLEDCHWLDAASHDLLEAIGYAIWNLPVLIVIAYRPPEVERLEAPRVSALAYFTLLSLAELDAEEIAHLIASRLAHLYPQETRQPPASLMTQLAARAQGNPFYIEELLNYLHDQGLDPFEVDGVAQGELPASLHALILSRMDRLTEPQKVTIKVASIIGRLFRFDWLLGYYPTLGEATEVRRDLDALSRLDLTPLESTEPERVYLFKHIVTREVAYESLAYATRATLHEQLASFIESLPGESEDSHLDLLTYHYALSENLPKKREYLRRAGEAAQAVYASAAALEYYEQLFPLLETAPEQGDVRLRLGDISELVGNYERAEAHYRAAEALAEAAGDALAHLRSQRGLGELLEKRGDYPGALVWLSQAQERAKALVATPVGQAEMSQLCLITGRVLTWQGDYTAARAQLEAGLALAHEAGDRPAMALALNHLGNVAFYAGEYREAIQLYEKSLALRRALGDKRGIATSLNNLGLVAQQRGEYTMACDLYEESLGLRQELGDKWGIASSLERLGDMAWYQGEYPTARQRYEASLLLWREVGDKRRIAILLASLGDAASHGGDYPSARALYEESLALRQELGDRVGIAGSLENLGMVARAQGEYTTAQQLFTESLALRRELGDREGVAGSLENLGVVARVQGEYTTAQQLFTESLALRRELGSKPGIVSNLNNLGYVVWRLGNEARAQDYFRGSLRLAQETEEKQIVVEALLGLAGLAAQQGNAASLRQAAWLLGAAERLRAAINFTFTSPMQVVYDEAQTAIRAVLSEVDFAAAWAEGTAMSLEEALALALSVEA